MANDYRPAEVQPSYAFSDDVNIAEYTNGSIAPSVGPSIQTNVTFATTATYKLPEPALILLPRNELMSKDVAKVCMCCKEKKFGLFVGKINCQTCGEVVCKKCTKRKHPLHRPFVICKHCYSKGMVQSYHMQESGWYHGPLSRHEAESRLKSKDALPGDYLVRESQGMDGFLALSVRGEDNTITHFLINLYRDLFYIGTARKVPSEQDELFNSIEEMLTSTAVIRLCRLRRAVIVEPPDDEICPRCKFVNPSVNTLFCGGCGTRLNSTQAERKLYYDLGLAMRDPSFSMPSGVNNPGYIPSNETPRASVQYESVTLVSNNAVPPIQEVSEPQSLASSNPLSTPLSPTVLAVRYDSLLEDEQMNTDNIDGGVFQEIDRTQLKIGNQLGQGFFGIVNSAVLQVPGKPPCPVAVKVLKDGASPQEEEAFLNEIDKVAQLLHPNVVFSYGACTRASPLLLVMELCSEGSLNSLLTKNDTRLTQPVKIGLVLGFTLGLEYIAGFKIVHRDVAARNCLVTIGSRGELIAKVSDMGLARDLVESYYHTSVGVDLARRWLAPEAMLFNTFSESSDVWAFGLVACETFQQFPGSLPFYFVVQVKELASKFEKESTTQGLVEELSKDLVRTCPGEIRELISLCLSYDRHSRPSFSDIAIRLTDAYEGTARWDFPRNNLAFVAELGHGAYGKVSRYRAINLVAGSVIDVAVKSCTDAGEMKRFLQEIEIMKSLRHAHIVRMLGACISGGQPWMVLEFLDQGSLDVFLRRAKTGLSPFDLQSILFQIATALAYIVKRQLVHRDVSARNCLVTLPLNVKLADFGLARETEESLYEQSTNTNIPVRWTAPECFRTRIFNEASDVFGFGTLAWEVFTYPWDRKKPFKHPVPMNELSDAQFASKLRTNSLPPLVCSAPSKYLTPLIKDVILRCRAKEPSERPTFDDLVKALSLFKN